MRSLDTYTRELSDEYTENILLFWEVSLCLRPPPSWTTYAWYLWPQPSKDYLLRESWKEESLNRMQAKGYFFILYPVLSFLFPFQFPFSSPFLLHLFSFSSFHPFLFLSSFRPFLLVFFMLCLDVPHSFSEFLCRSQTESGSSPVFVQPSRKHHTRSPRQNLEESHRCSSCS